ncbi:MAG TPA: malonyl-ACP O-methyltransferase BioC [Povalibacter sp.]|nr:malonyl-ACP O-methyltransferase BioC [Povalibacter sp.]
MPAPADEFFLDTRRVRAAFDAAAATFDSAAAVHTEIRARLLERLDLVRIDPAVVVDLGAGTGHATRALQGRYSRAQVIALDVSPAMLHQARRQQRLLRRFQRVAGDAQRLPLRDGSADLVFSNLMLQWCDNPDDVFRETRRVLRTGGLLTFTSLGPDSLRELRAAWTTIDTRTHVHRFIDMHDLGDALLRAGFAEPVMDTERLTVTYAGLDPLLAELRRSGSTNLALGRRRGLTGAAAGKRFRQAYEAARGESAWSLTLEVIYGHAWGTAAGRKLREPQSEAVVPLQQIGRRHSTDIK